MKKIKSNLFDIIDWSLIILCFMTMILTFIFQNCCILKRIGIGLGVIGLIYIFFILCIFVFKRIKFDWYLAKGNFLRKSVLVVFVVPFVLYAMMCWKKSPKEMLFQDALYECFDSQLECKYKKQQENPTLLWTIFYHYIDPGNQHMTTTKPGRNWAATIAVFGYILLNGLLVAVLIGWFDRRRDQWTKGEVRYKKRTFGLNRYAVVIGSNEVASSVIKNLLSNRMNNEINFKCEGDNKYIILQTCRDADAVREELASRLTEEELKKVVIYKALRDSEEEIEKLNLKYATEIYVLGESTLLDGGETYHDALNMKCVNLIAECLKDKNENKKFKRKVCKVMFEYQTTYSIFQFSDVSEKIKTNLVFIPFNRYESWARKVMVESFSNYNDGSLITYTPLDGKGIKADSDEHVHFVIVGMSKMGVAMGVQALLQCHYMNYSAAESVVNDKEREDLKNKRRTRITFIDTNADKEKDFFMGRYSNLFSLTRHRYFDANQDKLYLDPEYEWEDPMQSADCKWRHLSRGGQNFIDVEIEFVKGELESKGVRQYLRNISDENKDYVKESKLTVAICLTQTHQAIAASLYMPLEIYKKAQEIWVYQRESSDLVRNLIDTGIKDRRYKKLRPFGMLYGEYMSDRKHEYLMPMLVNEAYNIGVNGGTGSDIDLSKKETYKQIRDTWKVLSIDKMFSNRYFVDSIYLKIRSVMKDSSQCLTYTNIIELLRNDNDFINKLKPLLGNTNLNISEHNRWNMQQLLFGYSPCDESVDKEFEELNKKLDKKERDKWREKYASEYSGGTKKWEQLTLLEQLEAKDNDNVKDRYSETTNGKYDSKKKEYKEGLDRIHPNICEYEHLNKVDSGAKSYDETLNGAIPRILHLVEKHNAHNVDIDRNC